MKFFSIILLATVSVSAFATDIFYKKITNGYEASRLIEGLREKEGKGEFYKNGVQVNKFAGCYAIVESVDISTSDYQYSGEVLKMAVYNSPASNFNEIATDLDAWDYDLVKQTKANGPRVTLQYSRTLRNGRILKETFDVIKNKQVTYESELTLKNGNKKTEKAVCRF